MTVHFPFYTLSHQKGNSIAFVALPFLFFKSIDFSPLYLCMQGNVKMCLPVKPNFSTCRRGTSPTGEEWTFLLLLPWMWDMLRTTLPACSCLLPPVSTGKRSLSFTALREHEKPSGSSCFCSHRDLFQFLLNLDQECSLSTYRPPICAGLGLHFILWEKKCFGNGKFSPSEQLLEWKQ